MGYIGEGINQTATSVETAKDEFFGTYYGQISSDPTVDPNGEAITDGDLFYNTSEEALKIRVNGEWLSLRTATTGYQQFTATSGQTTFNVAGSFSPGFVFVTLNGVVLASGDYDDSSGTSIVLTSGAADGDILGVYLFDTFSVADTVSASAGGTFSGPVNFSDNINVDSGTLFVDSGNNRVGIRTSSPSEALELFSATTTRARMTSSGPIAGVVFETANRRFDIQANDFEDNGSLQIYDNTVDLTRLIIAPSGNVGIGRTSPSEKLEVNGNIIADGVYLGGTGSANYLDDYEEGTWTPEYLNNDGSQIASGYEIQIGEYTKIGNLVTVRIELRTANLTGNTGAWAAIGNLPFVLVSGRGALFLGRSSNWQDDHPMAAIATNDLFILQYRDSSDGRTEFLKNTDFRSGTNSNRIIALGHYYTDS